MNSKAKAQFAIAFQSQVVDDNIIAAESIVDYIRNLYEHDQAINCPVYEGPS